MMRPIASRVVLPAALYIGFVGYYVYLHAQLGRGFPLPWPDEAAFLWPATNFAETGSLLSPELLANHHPMWMPPGFMLVRAFFFKLFGFSFDLARWVSAAEVLLAFAGVAALASRLRAHLAALLLCGAFLVSTEFVAAGNIARMEGLVLCLSALAITLLASGRVLTALAVLSLAPLVHPNGVYFALAGLVFSVASTEPRSKLRHPIDSASRGEFIVVGVVVLCWCAYLVYVATHYTDFLLQMNAQLDRKVSRSNRIGISSTLLVALCTTSLACGLWGFVRNERILLLACFGTAAWCVRAVGLEVWYWVYLQFGLLLLSIAVLEILTTLWQESIAPVWLPNAAAGLALAWQFFIALALLALHWSFGSLPFPPGSLTAFSVAGMRPQLHLPYSSDDEMERLASALSEFRDCGEPLTIRTFPRAESLLLRESFGRNAFEYSSPAYLLLRLGGDYMPTQWDIFLVHMTPHHSWMSSRLPAELKMAGIDATSSENLLFATQTNSRWYIRVREDQVSEKCHASRNEDE
ncbi:MAG: glycosyltransferase family 39 protein [Myxococcota bacterium]|nr:glycosyltransferase family 39 protein [Myxococcota bacterium]